MSGGRALGEVDVLAEGNQANSGHGHVAKWQQPSKLVSIQRID
jgi:hypothetical protein